MGRIQRTWRSQGGRHSSFVVPSRFGHDVGRTLFSKIMKFGPDRRVRKRPEFQRIQKGGRRINTPHFVLVVARTQDPKSLPRLGITASKKVGNAVRRNRLKRVVRAAFRRLEGFVPPGHDLVVICKSDDSALGTDTVVQEWRSAAKRLKKVLAQLPVPTAQADSVEP